MTSNVQSNLENMPEHGDNIARVTPVEQTMSMVNLRDAKVGILQISRNAECWCDDASGLCTPWPGVSRDTQGITRYTYCYSSSVLVNGNTLFTAYSFGIHFIHLRIDDMT